MSRPNPFHPTLSIADDFRPCSVEPVPHFPVDLRIDVRWDIPPYPIQYHWCIEHNRWEYRDGIEIDRPLYACKNCFRKPVTDPVAYCSTRCSLIDNNIAYVRLWR